MSTFHLLSQDKRDELCSMLPQPDQNALLNHSNNYENYQQQQYHHHNHLNNENYNPSSAYNSYNNNNNNPDFFSKSENPIFWNSLTEWQTMLGHGDFFNPESPLQLSPSPPTTTNNSSSNKSTTSYGSKSHKPLKTSCKKDRFKVFIGLKYIEVHLQFNIFVYRMKHLSLIGVNLLIKKERTMLQGKYYMKIDKSTFF